MTRRRGIQKEISTTIYYKYTHTHTKYSLSIKTIPGVPRRLRPSFRQIQDYSHFEIGQVTLLYLYFLIRDLCICVKKLNISVTIVTMMWRKARQIWTAIKYLNTSLLIKIIPGVRSSFTQSKIFTICGWWWWFLFVFASFYMYLHLFYDISCFKICVFVFKTQSIGEYSDGEEEEGKENI